MSIDLIKRDWKQIHIPDLTQEELKYYLIPNYSPILIFSRDILLIPKSCVFEINKEKDKYDPFFKSHYKDCERFDCINCNGNGYYIQLSHQHLEEDRREGLCGRTLLHEFLHLQLDYHGIKLEDSPHWRAHSEFEKEIEREATRLTKEHPELLRAIRKYYHIGKNNPIGI